MFDKDSLFNELIDLKIKGESRKISRDKDIALKLNVIN
jgi:hypothetical protein